MVAPVCRAASGRRARHAPGVRRSRLLLVPALLTLLTASACGTGSTGSAPADTASTGGAAGVSTRQLDLRDPSRVTDPTPAEPGSDAVAGRDLPTTLWYPTSGDGPFPVVVLSHGFGAGPEAYLELAEAWATAGAVVAAPTFPLTSGGSAMVDTDVTNQPADVSFVLDQVLALDDDADDDLAGRIDTAHVAVAGHSLGAITTLGLLNSCCADPRVDAAVVLAGDPRVFTAPAAEPGVPTLFVHGTADDVLPIAGGRAAYDAATGAKAFVQLPGATHSAPYDDPSDQYSATVRTVTTDFLRWTLGGDAQALADLRADAVVPGRAELVDDQLG